MGAVLWHCKLCIPDLPGAQCPHGSVHGIPQVTRMLCFRSMIFQFSSAANSRQAAGTVFFFPVATYGIILAFAVIQQDIFWVSVAEEKPAVAIFAFWECDDKGINYLFSL